MANLDPTDVHTQKLKIKISYFERNIGSTNKHRWYKCGIIKYTCLHLNMYSVYVPS